jgi:hypothetical protein
LRRSQPRDEIPDAAYRTMQTTLLKAMDGVSQHGFVFNWMNLLSDNVTVCYPFAGVVDSSCELGLAQVKKVWAQQAAMNGTVAIEQDAYYISRSAAGLKLGVWSYTTAASYIHNGKSCVVMFQGTAMYALDPTDPTRIITWLESPDQDRIDNTYPCV